MSIDLDAAFIVAADRAPYLQAILFSLIPRERPGMANIIGPVGINERHILYYDPIYLKKLNVEQVATALEHECYHIALDFWGRRGERPHLKWNVAHDLEINSMLSQNHRQIPKDWMMPSKFKLKDGQTAEWYYDNLPDEHGKGCGCEESQGGADEKDGEGVSREASEMIRQEFLQQAAQHPGTDPGLRNFALKKLAPPEIDWRLVLRHRARRAVDMTTGRSDFSYRRPSRRFSAMATAIRPTPIMPGMVDHKPSIRLIVDSSGSMMSGQFEKALSEVMGVVNTLGVPVKTTSWDVVNAAEAEIRNVADLARLGSGGGGTDMAEALREIAKKRPSLIILFTDCYTPWPDPEEMKSLPEILVVAVGDEQIPPHMGKPIRVKFNGS